MSVKQIVFDMGRVLIDYDADLATKQLTDDPAVLKEVRDVVYHSGEWILLDAGLITEEEALKSMHRHCSSETVWKIAEKSFLTWDRYNMIPIEGMDAVVRDLKAAGYGVYVLSNASVRLLEAYRDIIPEWEIMDGLFFSASYGCLKPQRQIYELFTEKYNLKPEECLFIDDLKRNVDGAIACGWQGLWYTERNSAILRDRLTSLGIMGYNR